MSMFTEPEILQGIGAFEQAMRTQTRVPGVTHRMSPGVAIGVLSAMMKSGLTDAKIKEVIANDFAPNAAQLNQLLTMFCGDDWTINLWNLLPSGHYKLCTELCRAPKPGWRFDPNAGSEVY